MIHISETAQQHFRRLLQNQGGDAAGILITAIQPGTSAADCRLAFCEQAELRGNEWEIDYEGFRLFVAGDSVPYLDEAEIDFRSDSTGGQLTVRAPHLKGVPPNTDAALDARVRWLLDSEINPQLATHGGRVQLEQITPEGEVVLRFGGGCHGCGQVDVTLREGIERTLLSRFPELTGVRDATDHASGSSPFYR